MVVLLLCEAVVDEEGDSAAQRSGDRAHQRLGGEVHFREVFVVARRNDRVRAALELAIGKSHVLPAEPGLGDHHAPFEDLRVGAMHERARKDIQHLIGNDHAIDALRQALDPLESVDFARVTPGDARTLAFAQLRAHLEKAVARRRETLRLELRVEIRGQDA